MEQGQIKKRFAFEVYDCKGHLISGTRILWNWYG